MKFNDDYYTHLIKNPSENPYERRLVNQIERLIKSGVPLYEILGNMELQNTKIQVNYDPGEMEAIVNLHSHIFYEILFVSEGTADYLVGTQCFRVHTGDIVLLPPGINHSPLNRIQNKEVYRRYTVWIDPAFFQEICEQYSDIGKTLLKFRDEHCYLLRSSESGIHSLSASFEKMKLELEQCRPGYDLAIVAGALTVLPQICRTYYPSSDMGFVHSDDKLFDNMLCYVEEHFEEKLTLEQIALHFHVSASTVSHSFRQNIDSSFYQFVLRRRLLEAKKMLLGGLPLRQISDDCGFSDYSSFYRLFKKEYGLAPSEYLTLHRQSKKYT